MHPIARRFGTLAFRLAWPLWIIYFRLVPRRSRVLVVAEGKLLLVRGWLGRNDFGLPGGGAKRNESTELSACRELNEEVGLKADPAQLEPLGQYHHNERGLKYDAIYFLLKIDEEFQPTLQKHEIAEAGWYSQGQVAKLHLNKDAKFALEQYADRIWYN